MQGSPSLEPSTQSGCRVGLAVCGLDVGAGVMMAVGAGVVGAAVVGARDGAVVG